MCAVISLNSWQSLSSFLARFTYGVGVSAKRGCCCRRRRVCLYECESSCVCVGICVVVCLDMDAGAGVCLDVECGCCCRRKQYMSLAVGVWFGFLLWCV